MEGENKHWRKIDMVKTEFLIIDEASMGSASDILPAINKFVADEQKAFWKQMETLYHEGMLDNDDRINCKEDIYKLETNLTIMLSGDDEQLGVVKGGQNIYEALEEPEIFMKSPTGN